MLMKVFCPELLHRCHLYGNCCWNNLEFVGIFKKFFFCHHI